MGHDEEAAGTADEEEEGKSGEGRKIKNGHVGCEAPWGGHQVQNLELTKAQWMCTKIDFFERSCRVSHPIVREILSCFVLGVLLPCLGSS